ncbi:hypothetical protein Tco_0276861 [Tanacetum coccineum]
MNEIENHSVIEIDLDWTINVYPEILNLVSSFRRKRNYKSDPGNTRKSEIREIQIRERWEVKTLAHGTLSFPCWIIKISSTTSIDPPYLGYSFLEEVDE